MSPSPRSTKRPWLLALARRYARWRARRSLAGVRADGLEEVVALARRSPLILAPNHVSFWDAFLMVLVDETLGTDGYVLMDRGNLERLRFFGLLGALPLDRSSPEAAARDLEAVAALLCRPGRAVWIYPQGHHRPHHLRPLGFKRGVCRLAALSGAPVVPVAFAYHFRDEPQPEARVRLGAPIAASEPALRERLEARVAEMLSALDADFVARAPAERMLAPARGRSFERGLGARLLGGRGA